MAGGVIGRVGGGGQGCDNNPTSEGLGSSAARVRYARQGIEYRVNLRDWDPSVLPYLRSAALRHRLCERHRTLRRGAVVQGCIFQDRTHVI
jgi:hypothetical protein